MHRPLRPHRRTAPEDRHRDHAQAHGARRRLRPARRRLPSLLGGRALGGAALREDVLRQLGAAEELRARLPGTGRPILRRGRARHHPLDGRGAQRPRARRLLRLAGRRHQHGRRRRLLHLDARRSPRRAQRGRTRRPPAITTTSAKSARCTTTRRRTCCTCALRWRRSPPAWARRPSACARCSIPQSRRCCAARLQAAHALRGQDRVRELERALRFRVSRRRPRARNSRTPATSRCARSTAFWRKRGSRSPG